MGSSVLSSEGFHARVHNGTRPHAGLEPEFKKRNTKIIGLSVDPVASHGKWSADIEEAVGHKVN